MSVVHYQPSQNNKDKVFDTFESESGSRNNVETTKPFTTIQLDLTESIGEIKSYQSWSIFNTLCCCLGLGIVALIYSCMTKQLKKQVNFDEARKASRKALIYNIIATITGISSSSSKLSF
jgi:hypothetical protein